VLAPFDECILGRAWGELRYIPVALSKELADTIGCRSSWRVAALDALPNGVGRVFRPMLFPCGCRVGRKTFPIPSARRCYSRLVLGAESRRRRGWDRSPARPRYGNGWLAAEPERHSSSIAEGVCQHERTPPKLVRRRALCSSQRGREGFPGNALSTWLMRWPENLPDPVCAVLLSALGFRGRRG
jgi:hypothetical protein